MYKLHILLINYYASIVSINAAYLRVGLSLVRRDDLAKNTSICLNRFYSLSAINNHYLRRVVQTQRRREVDDYETLRHNLAKTQQLWSEFVEKYKIRSLRNRKLNAQWQEFNKEKENELE